MISVFLLTGVTFFIIFRVLVNKDRFLQRIKTAHDLLYEQRALKMALAMSLTKEETLPHKTYLISRERCTQKLFLLIMVPTQPSFFDRRSVIRETWGTDPSTKTRWRTVFLLGQAANDSIQNEYLKVEEIMHGDIVRGAQTEDFNNLTLKMQMGLEWASKYCDFQYLLKADDDVFVNPYLLMDYLRKPDTPKTKLYTGMCQYGKNPFRGTGNYSVTVEDYNRTTYPDFCSSPAYLLSSDMVHKLVEMFDVSKKPFKMEDVYIGQLVEKMGDVKSINHSSFRYSTGNCSLSPVTFTQHRVSVECMGELFNLAIKQRLEQELTQLRSRIKTGSNNAEH